MSRAVVAAAVAAAVAVGGCSSGTTRQGAVTVFAAASLSNVFAVLRPPFDKAHPGYVLRYSFAGSQQLVAQLHQGAKADVLATADRPTMSAAQADGLRRKPVVFARNKLVIVVRKGNPLHVAGLADLSRDGLRVVLAAPAVPAGRYARQALASAAVTVRPVSLEDSVAGVLGKVGLGEADAGIAYATDARAMSGVQAIAVPDANNVTAEYLVAEPASVGDRRGADAFVDFLRSGSAQRELRRSGFLLP